MKVLIIGNGGREHALAWKAAQSPLADHVYVAPGNGGTAREPGVENVPIAADDIPALVAFAAAQGIGLTIVGPEAPLVAGVTDAFEAAELRCLGPRQAAAQLEGSKAFTKAFLARHGIPTAAYGTFSEVGPALDYLRQVGAPVVVKADGLAAGKGVILAQDLATAEAAVRDMLEAGRFGGAGRRLVIEEFLYGEEASFIALVGGGHILPMASSQDHKARDDGDLGPNTGGMGAYSPAPVLTPEIHARVMREVMEPTVAGLAAEGMDYLGFLYAGLMIAPDGTPKVLEYNCRFGDPETQPILMRLQSDLVALALAACQRRLRPRGGPLGPASRPGRGHGRRRLPGRLRQGRGHPGARHPRAGRLQGIPCGYEPCARGRSSPTAGASSASPPWGPQSERPRPWPMPGSVRSTGATPTGAATSVIAP